MKDIKFLVLLVALAIVSFVGCNNIMQPSDLVQYVQNPKNGLHKEKTVGLFTVDLQYKPLPFVIANEFRKNVIKGVDYYSRKKELENLQHFNLKLSINEPGKDITNYGLENQADQQGRLYYLSFGMKNDIRLVEGSDTLAPVLYHFERSYDLAGHRTFVLAFPSKENSENKEKTLVFNPRILDTGPIKIKIEETDLKKMPKIKLL